MCVCFAAKVLCLQCRQKVTAGRGALAAAVAVVVETASAGPPRGRRGATKRRGVDVAG